MDGRPKLFGHPGHPMLVIIPLGLLTAAVICDIVYLVSESAHFAMVAWWNIAFGCAGGLLAALFGFVDWSSLPRATRTRRIGFWHAMGNLIVAGMFAVCWYMRRADPEHLPTDTSLIIALVGVALALATGWLGGELMDRLGVGVDQGTPLHPQGSFSGPPGDPHLPPT